METLSFLASVSVRSCCLALAALAAIVVFRVKSAAATHAVWTAVLGGMLLLAVVTPVLPPVPLPILRAEGPIVLPGFHSPAGLPSVPLAALHGPAPAAAPQSFPWQTAVFAIYAAIAFVLLIRLAFGYLFTRRLMRASRVVEGDWMCEVFESAWISVPMTAGWFRPRILLPVGWNTWPQSKLDAVMAHERTHVRRGDWAIALISSVNRCLFWFHPLAWWLDRRLASLAEQACDDAALLEVAARENYAQALLDMAAAVKTGQGRLLWEAMAMSKAAEVRKRIDRILDETRQIPHGLTRSRWALLLLCAFPLVYVTSVLRPVPAAAQQPPAIAELRNRTFTSLTAADANAMEQYLAGNPQDLDVRSRLVFYYYSVPEGNGERRLGHTLWLIANHPESSAAFVASFGMTPRTTVLNSATDFQRAQGLWKQQAAARPTDARVLANAGAFLGNAGEYADAERLLLAARAIDSGAGTERLGNLYATAILRASGDARFPGGDAAFADHARTLLESSNDASLLFYTGNPLANVAKRPKPGEQLPSGVLRLDDHPMLAPAVELGERLLARNHELGGALAMARDALARYGNGAPPADHGVRGGVVGGVVGSVPGGVSGGTPGGVVGGIITAPTNSGPAPQNVVANPQQPPQVINRIMPEYPALARQARIQADSKIRATIGKDGSVIHFQIISSHPLLVANAIEALKKWSFKPAMQNGQPVDATVDVVVPFRLDGGDGPLPVPQAIQQMPAPPVPARIKVGANVQAARLQNKIDPVYPAQARAAGIEGEVKLEITISPEGTVENVNPVDGNPVLIPAAADAVRQWTYKPTLLNNQPVTVLTTVTVPFTLQ